MRQLNGKSPIEYQGTMERTECNQRIGKFLGCKPSQTMMIAAIRNIPTHNFILSLSWRARPLQTLNTYGGKGKLFRARRRKGGGPRM